MFGVVNPVLLLPASLFEHLNPEQLSAVIAHEMCHVRRRDNLAAAVHMFVETVFWFHPAVWWIGRRMLDERERACDEGVLSTGSEPRIYAEAVLNVCRLYVEGRWECVSGIAGGNLKARIEAIMSKRIADDLNFAKKLGLAFAAIAILLTPVFVGMLHASTALAQAELPAPVAVQAPPAMPQQGRTPAAPAPGQVVVKDPQVFVPTPRVVPAPQAAPQAKGVPEPQIAPGTSPGEAKSIRTAWAQANLPSRPMIYAYGLFGPPNHKDNRGAVETWDYDYLDDYQSRVTLEFSSSQTGPRITWPQQTRFDADGQSDIAVIARLANELGRQLNLDTSIAPQTGIPGGQAFLEPSLRLNRAEHLMNLMLPTGSLSGQIDLIGSITDTFGMVVANLRDNFEAPAGTRQITFTLLPGPYLCNLLVREASGVMYSESIPFRVQK